MTPGKAVSHEHASILFEDRLSDSPLVERVWRCRSERGGKFISMAASHFEMVVTRLRGKSFLTVRGPETKATILDCPEDGEWVFVRFKLGTFMPQLPPGGLKDHNDVTLLVASSRTFWLNGSSWQYPDFENAETFVQRLTKDGLILTGYLGGGVASQLRAGNGWFNVVFPVIFGALVWAGLWLRDVRVRSLLP